MKLAKTLVIVLIVMVLFMARINAIIDNETEEEENFVQEEEVPALDSDSVSTDLSSTESEQSSFQGLGRFLLAKNKRKQLKCNKNPRICRAKGSPGPFCCKKKCVDVRMDRLNCGLCGKKCKYNETCCKGKCINVAFDKRHCGRCNNRCGSGDFCSYGLCSYA
ncbi:stigma-specific STIG1-like protein 1 [Magnolia sinica]|uniref:stigma-specific STIG1-like protein 1 n=1 Tax=Magnolia sinica TaxID=86752 RepID=UPI002657DCFE|nr:stigma-specific STIG1-like protein 1 [Magnolia sinica]